MEYRRRLDGALFNDITIRNEYPAIAFPPELTTAMLSGLGFDPVLYAAPPTYTDGQVLSRNGVTQDSNGNWIFAWTVTTLPSSIEVANLSAEEAAVATHSPNMLWYTPTSQ